MQMTGIHAAARPGREAMRGRGMLAIAGAVAFTIHIVLRSLLTAGVDPAVSAQGTWWIPVNALGAVGAALVLLGMPAIAGRLVKPGSRGGTIGLALLAGAWLFFGLFLSLYGALVLPWIAREAPEVLSGTPPVAFGVAFALGALAWLAGSVLLAREAIDRLVRWALPASAVWFLVGSFAIAPEGPASNLAVNLVSNLGPVMLVAALGYAGYRERRDRPRRPVVQHA